MKRRHRHPSDTALAHQLHKARREIARLEAKIAALTATNIPRVDLRLLEAVAAALADAAEASDPRQASAIDDTRSHSRRPSDSPIPGASTAPARRWARRLHRDLEHAVARWWAAKQRGWQPEPKPPSVRCGNRRCPLYDRRRPSLIRLPDGTRQPAGHCPACGRPYPPRTTANSREQAS